MMNKIFQEEIGETLEVYMDDMIVKYDQDEIHAQQLKWVFKMVKEYNMRLNLEKWTFDVWTNKFLGFYLTEQGIEATLNKREKVIWICSLTLN